MSTVTIRSVAVIGLGAMGTPMARRLLDAGFELTVCDTNTAVLAPFAASGATIAPTPAHCAAAQVVLVLVAKGEQVLEAVLGLQGIVSGIAGGRPPVVVVMSTVPAETVLDISRALGSSGVRLIDAPISGGVLRAEDGTLTIMAGGEPEDIEAVGPVFASLGTHRFHCGGLGSAQTVKIVNNIIAVANTLIGAEAYRLAQEKGLDIAKVAEVLDVSTGRNYLSAAPGPAAVFSTMVRSREEFITLSAIIKKDIGMATTLSGSIGGSYPAIAALKTLVDSMDGDTFEHWQRLSGA